MVERRRAANIERRRAANIRCEKARRFAVTPVGNGLHGRASRLRATTKTIVNTDAVEECRQKFLRFFPKAFQDQKYLEWERNYKTDAHSRWAEELGRDAFKNLLFRGRYQEVAQIAVSIESRTNLLFSFEKMAIRDAVRSISGACTFSVALYEFLYGKIEFDEWCFNLAKLPRKKTRVLSWPIATVFPFLAMPAEHIFLKPNVTRKAAASYGYPFRYKSTPSKDVYEDLLKFAGVLKKSLADLQPRDMIDIQSFIWVLGSDEYDE